jgi:hypothetical protein
MPNATAILHRKPTPASAAAQNPLIDVAAFPILTEEVGYPPSPLSKPSSGSDGSGGGSSQIGQLVTRAVTDVLGWKVKSGDSKAFVNALTQSFTLTDVEGHVEATWKARTYAVQTDLSGGITGAQASLYTRGKEALDQALPLLNGLYALDSEADAEDVTALKAVAVSQASELVTELKYPSGPRIQRVNQYFHLLIGHAFPHPPSPNAALKKTDPDAIGGTLGRLRDELGLSFTRQDFVNSVEDETNLSNFRIISDYITSLAQSWLNNLSFVRLDTATPFFGTQLVLLSRQLSVVAESVDEVRFILDSVFIGPAERQTMQLNFPAPHAPMFLEDLLSWIQAFCTEEGPRLIQDGGKFGVQNTFTPVAERLSQIVHMIPSTPPTPNTLPPAFFAPRVKMSVADLRKQLKELVGLASKIQHDITPEHDFALPFEALSVMPATVESTYPGSFLVRGHGFQAGATVSFDSVPQTTHFRSEDLLVVSPGALATGDHVVAVKNADGKSRHAPEPLTVI